MLAPRFDLSQFNPVRSLEFWRRRKPELYARVRAEQLSGELCPVCKGAMPYLDLRMADGSEEKYLHCVCLCPEIEDELRALVSSINDVPRFQARKTFSDLRQRGTAEEWAAVRKITTLLTEIVERPYDHRWLTIWGGAGSGKTHLLLAAQAMMPHICAYVYADMLSKRIHAALDDNSLPELEDRVVAVPVLIIDDLGVEYAGSEFAKSQFTTIINRRYVEGPHRPTIVSTNLGRKSLNARYDRLASRILDADLVDWVPILLWDYRQHGLHRPSAESFIAATPTMRKVEEGKV